MTILEGVPSFLLDIQSINVPCPFQVTQAVSNFVIENLGPLFVESPSIDLSILYASMVCTSPLVFILSTGSDPMSSFLRFAKEMGYTERYVRTYVCTRRGADSLNELSCPGGRHSDVIYSIG